MEDTKQQILLIVDNILPDNIPLPEQQQMDPVLFPPGFQESAFIFIEMALGFWAMSCRAPFSTRLTFCDAWSMTISFKWDIDSSFWI
jgi:hypothetical protein